MLTSNLMIHGNQMGKKRNIQPPPIIPGRIKVEIKDEIGNKNA